MDFVMRPVGIVRAKRTTLEDDYWGGSEATIELSPGVPKASLDGIETFSHVEIVYVFDRVKEDEIVKGARHPRGRMSWPLVGIFAQRAKSRPNRIGTTIARIVRREASALVVAELDAIDGTPVLDIKPVIRELLPRGEVVQPQWVSELMVSYWAPGDETPR